MDHLYCSYVTWLKVQSQYDDIDSPPCVLCYMEMTVLLVWNTLPPSGCFESRQELHDWVGKSANQSYFSSDHQSNGFHIFCQSFTLTFKTVQMKILHFIWSSQTESRSMSPARTPWPIIHLPWTRWEILRRRHLWGKVWELMLLGEGHGQIVDVFKMIITIITSISGGWRMCSDPILE